jgi:hypothetical protein
MSLLGAGTVLFSALTIKHGNRSTTEIAKVAQTLIKMFTLLF